MANPDGAKPRKEEANMAMTVSSRGVRNDQEYSSDAEGQSYEESAMLMAKNAKKKSCFQITSVKASETPNDDNDSADDMDESRAEDFSSSELLDVSKSSTQTDLERLELGENSHSTPIKKVPTNNVPPTNSSIVNVGNQAIPSNGDQNALKRRTGSEPPHELQNQLSDSGKQTTNGTQHGNGNPASRFKVVKVPRIEPFTRGRWTCRDFETQASTTQNTDANRTEQNKDLHSGDSSAASSVHYVPGENPPADNPFIGGDTGTTEQFGNINSISSRLGVKSETDKRHISPEDHHGQGSSSLEDTIKETLSADHSSGPTEDTALSSEDGDG